jgi:REP-associated tyrosine transposase
VLAEQRRHRRSAQSTLFEHSTQRIWQARYYDFNVCTARKRVEKLRYMHRNPVKRGLVEAPELWRWSSFRAYAYQESGAVRLNDWSAHKLKFCEAMTFQQ